MQQAVHVLPRRVRFLIRRRDLRQPALLDLDHGRFEAARQRWRANGSTQRLPAFRQLRVVDRRARGKLLGLHDQGFGIGLRPQLLLPRVEASLRIQELRGGRVVAVRCRLVAQRGEFVAEVREGFRRRGGTRRREQCAEPTLEAPSRLLLLSLAVEARQEHLACRG